MLIQTYQIVIQRIPLYIDKTLYFVYSLTHFYHMKKQSVLNYKQNSSQLLITSQVTGEAIEPFTVKIITMKRLTLIICLAAEASQWLPHAHIDV